MYRPDSSSTQAPRRPRHRAVKVQVQVRRINRDAAPDADLRTGHRRVHEPEDPRRMLARRAAELASRGALDAAARRRLVHLAGMLGIRGSEARLILSLAAHHQRPRPAAPTAQPASAARRNRRKPAVFLAVLLLLAVEAAATALLLL